MSGESEGPGVATPLPQDIAHDEALWIVPALCALFARAVPSPAVVQRTRQLAAEPKDTLLELLLAAGFNAALRKDLGIGLVKAIRKQAGI